MEYISISSILKNATVQYARAYLYTESDGNDTTYFIDYNLRVIIRALDRLRDYLSRKAEEIQRVENVLGEPMVSRQFNHRQLAVISHAIRNPGQVITIKSHRQSHGVTYPTARSDLLKFVDKCLLTKSKVGSVFLFEPADNIEERMRA